MGDQVRRRRTLVAVLLLTIGSAVGALLLGEGYVRLFSPYGYVTPEILKQESLQYDPAVFARHVFPLREQSVLGIDGAKFHIDREGFRGREVEAEKPPGTLRIVIYGGSAAFDVTASDPLDWPHRVETRLHAMGFPRVEVINAGVPGHASFDAFGRFFAEGYRLAPDYVLIYNAWNDIKYFRSAKSLLRELQPYDPRSDPRLNYQGWLDRLLSEHSQLFVRLRSNYYNWRLQAGKEGSKPPGAYSSRIEPAAVRQYEIDLDLFVDLARDIGAVPVLMTQARLVTRQNTAAERSRIAYEFALLTPDALVDAFEATDRAIEKVAREKHVAVIDASAALTGKDEFFLDHVHVTKAGSKALADVTAQGMARLIRAAAQAGTPP